MDAIALLFLGTCIICFSQVLRTFSGSFLFYFIFFVPYFGLVTTEIRFFALKSKKEKGTG